MTCTHNTVRWVATLALAAFGLAGCASTAPNGGSPVTPPPAPSAPAPAYGTMAPIPNPTEPGPTPARPAREPRPKAAPPSEPPPSAAAQTPPTTPAINQQRATALRAQGLEELNRGNIGHAVALLQQANQLDPSSALIKRDLDRALRIQQAVKAR